MLNTLGTGAVLPKIASPDSDSWPTAEDIFRAGCEGGAKAFGLGDRLGKIEPGFKADLVCYDLDATTLTPLNHPVRQIVYGERGAAIREVFVDGCHVVRDGRNALVDETALLREMQAAHAELGDTLVSSQADAAPFHDALMRVYLRALSCPIAGDHYAALMTGNNIAGQTPNA
jgi:guanine deaminase